MPQISEKAQALADIETAPESAACTYLLASSDEEDEAASDIEDLLMIQEIVDSHRYLSSRGKRAGRHGNHDSLEGYICEYPESSFRSLFRMQRASFWQLVEILTHAEGPEYWCQNDVGRGRPPRPIYQQIAAGL